MHTLREQPWLALPLLQPLRSDPSKYVQNSVANWLNDAGKDHPGWVQALTENWLQDAKANKATQYIVKRARRNLAE